MVIAMVGSEAMDVTSGRQKHTGTVSKQSYALILAQA
jgi:hypothetical protein